MYNTKLMTPHTWERDPNDIVPLKYYPKLYRAYVCTRCGWRAVGKSPEDINIEYGPKGNFPAFTFADCDAVVIARVQNS
jgi:hypothetical protein